MQTESERKQTSKCAWKVTAIICIIALLGIGVYEGHTYLKEIDYFNQFQSKSDTTSEVCKDTARVILYQDIDEAVREFEMSVKDDQDYQRYIKLSPIVIRKIFEKIGTNALIDQIIFEFDKNKEYYLSIEAADQIRNIKLKGLDSDSIDRIEVTTILKNKAEDTSTINVKPITR